MPSIGQPIQGYYYDLATDTLRPIMGMSGPGGFSQFGVDFVADASANVTLTSLAAAEDYLGTSVRYAHKLDLAGYTQCRFLVRKMATAGTATSKLALKYSTTNPANAFSAGAWTTSGAELLLNNTNTNLDTGWIAMPAGMCVNDIYVCPTQQGGDGATSPVVGNIQAYFRASGIVPNMSRAEMKVQMAASSGQTATAYTSLYQPCVFDKSRFVGYSQIVYQADLVNSNAGNGQLWAQLAFLNTAVGITQSEVTQVSAAQNAHNLKDSPDISAYLTNGPDVYMNQVKTVAGASLAIPFSAIVVRY